MTGCCQEASEAHCPRQAGWLLLGIAGFISCPWRSSSEALRSSSARTTSSTCSLTSPCRRSRRPSRAARSASTSALPRRSPGAGDAEVLVVHGAPVTVEGGFYEHDERDAKQGGNLPRVSSRGRSLSGGALEW